MALSVCAYCETRRAGQLGKGNEPLKTTHETRGPNSREEWKRNRMDNTQGKGIWDMEYGTWEMKDGKG